MPGRRYVPTCGLVPAHILLLLLQNISDIMAYVLALTSAVQAISDGHHAPDSYFNTRTDDQRLSHNQVARYVPTCGLVPSHILVVLLLQNLSDIMAYVLALTSAVQAISDGRHACTRFLLQHTD